MIQKEIEIREGFQKNGNLKWRGGNLNADCVTMKQQTKNIWRNIWKPMNAKNVMCVMK